MNQTLDPQRSFTVIGTSNEMLVYMRSHISLKSDDSHMRLSMQRRWITQFVSGAQNHGRNYNMSESYFMHLFLYSVTAHSFLTRSLSESSLRKTNIKFVPLTHSHYNHTILEFREDRFLNLSNDSIFVKTDSCIYQCKTHNGLLNLQSK